MRCVPSTYVLTNDEKLIARRALRLWRASWRNPQPDEEEWLKAGWYASQIEVAFDAMSWLAFMRKTGGRYELAETVPLFLRGLGFYFHGIVRAARAEYFTTNCATDVFIMTCSPARETMLERASGGSISAKTESMSEKMLEALHGENASGARGLRDSGFFGAEVTMLNDACGWSDEPIKVVMDHGKLVEVSPDTTWYLLGGG